MQPRIERRRLHGGRWLLYLLIAVSACALARLASAGAPQSAHQAQAATPAPLGAAV